MKARSFICMVVPVVAAVAFAVLPASAGAASSADLAVSWVANDAMVVNNGPSTAYNVQLVERSARTVCYAYNLCILLTPTTSPTPSGCVPSTSSLVGLTCTWASLAPNQSVTVHERYGVYGMTEFGKPFYPRIGGTLPMTATVSSSTPDPNTANNTASVNWTIPGPTPFYPIHYFYFG
jgi:hypothetical protein